jgi:putative transcriptional regulator
MAVSNKDFEGIMGGLAEVAAFTRGDNNHAVQVFIPAEIDIKTIRGTLRMTQAQFAERHGFSVGAVRDWEQGRTVPDPSTRAFLKVIAAMPAEVERILALA